MTNPINGMPDRNWRRYVGLFVVLVTCALPGPFALADPAQEFAEADSKFAEAWRDQNLEEALPWARKRVEILSNQDRMSPQLLVPLLQLTAVEVQLSESVAALETIEHAVRILKKQPDDTTLLEFLMFKAQAYTAEFETADAFDTFGEAVKVNKRIEPYDLLREAMIYDAYLDAAKSRGAREKRKGDFAADKALSAREKLYGKDSIELIPGLEAYAEWCNYSSQFGDERETRERIIEIISQQAGSSNFRIAKQAIIIAKSHIYQRTQADDAAQVMELTQELDYPATAEGVAMHAQALAVSGDVQVVFGKEEKAADFYRNAWQLLADFLGPAEANRFFGREALLVFNFPDNPARGKSGEAYFESGTVTSEFTVLPNGRLKDVEFRSDIAKLDDTEFYKASRRARYRPRVVDGEPVSTADVIYKYRYQRLRR
ncbi:MAG: hypothetical protein QF790_02015 [Gammaproteobacteria bacterium]|jgi:tetratricopeptide (TPR) repeat protein|nr:hypothetical protein [Gammaproteobacteria bacterium]MDP6615925.1 hypothetical protein [Gammaproteobacteria bacterium]MDP6695036.1 hypothetical protein [Gammaproteobacteria bacterium]